MTESSGDAPRDAVAQDDASAAPFTRGTFVVLIIAAIVIPPLGMLIGAFNMDKPARRTQSKLLLAIGVGIVVLVVLSTA